MTVMQLITAAFMLARSRYPELHKTWINMSARVGGLLPNSRLMVSVHRTGELDMVLRCMEDDLLRHKKARKRLTYFRAIIR